MASSFSDADLAHAAALFAALVFTVPRGEIERRADVFADTWYAALLTGFALGVKVSAAPAALDHSRDHGAARACRRPSGASSGDGPCS